MKIKLLKYSIVLLLFPFFSCSKLNLAPTNEFTELNYWTTLSKADYVLNTAYAQMFNSSSMIDNEFLSDNVFEGRGGDESEIVAGVANASIGRFANEWSSCYSGIKTCHVFMANVGNVQGISDSLKKQMIAQARFIRAFLYFRLANWFGDVPFFTQDISLDESKTIARTPYAQVISFVHSELDDIATILPTKQQYTLSDAGRITRGAAIALNTRVYLYDNDWQNVVKYCEMLINSNNYGSYSLYPDYASLFKPQGQNSSEDILDMQYAPGAASTRNWSNMLDLIPITCGGRVNQAAPTQELVDSYIMLDGLPITASGSGYDPDNPYVGRDPRLEATIVHNLSSMVQRGATTAHLIYTKPGSTNDPNFTPDIYVGGGGNSTTTGYYYRKLYDSSALDGMASGMNLMLIRYADVLLMEAEAKNELGQMDATVWNNTIRPIRIRAGFTASGALDFPSVSQDSMRSIIRNERRSEFALEGTRIFDIRRWKLSESVLNGYPHGAQFGDPTIDNGFLRLTKRTFNPQRDYLWPIPQSQMDLDPNLTQNPNY